MRKRPRIALAILTLAIACLVALPSSRHWLFQIARPRISYDEALLDLETNCEDIAQFVAYLPRADSSISYFTGEYGTPSWGAQLYAPQFEIHASMAIEINRRGHTAKCRGQMTILILQIESTDSLPDGRKSVHYGGSVGLNLVQLKMVLDGIDPALEQQVFRNAPELLKTLKDYQAQSSH